MKKIIIKTAALSLLLLTGCAQNAPDLDGKGSSSNISDASALTGDTVSINENAYGNESGGRNNSSSDGFQSVYFDFGDYGISSDMENAISKNVNVAGSTGGKRIKIEGNCDEFGTDEYNYALGLKRAKSVKDSMSSQGINTSNMVMVSFGESNPVCSSPTDSCYGKNRRVDLRLVK
jgi:peptidoglycan-associated lipoprotein